DASGWEMRSMADPKADLHEEEPSASRPAGSPGDVTPLSLLERARARDPEAWHRLVQLYQPLVLFWCNRGGLRGRDAGDVAQEVLAGVAAGLGNFHRARAGGTFRGWLRGITRNQALLHFRRNQGEAQAQGGSDAWRHLQAVPDSWPCATS